MKDNFDIINKDNMFNIAFDNRYNTYIKTNECLNCKYLYICDGIEPNLLLNNILTHVDGIKIKEI